MKIAPNFRFIILAENHTKRLPRRSILHKAIEILRFRSYSEIPFLLWQLSKRIPITIIHAHNYRPTFFAQVANKVLHKPLFMEMHSIYDTSRLKNAIGSWLLRRSDLIIVPSESAKGYLTSHGVQEKKVHVIYNGIDLERFRNSQSSSALLDKYEEMAAFISKFRLRVGYIGSFHIWQGVHEFLDIAYNVSQTRNDVGFLMIGDGPEFPQISARIKESPLLSNVYIHPAIPREDVLLFYKLIHILLVPRPSTLATETALPLKAVEALASGNLVVGTEVGGLRELQGMVSSGVLLFKNKSEISAFLQNLSGLPNMPKYQGGKALDMFSAHRQAGILLDLYDRYG